MKNDLAWDGYTNARDLGGLPTSLGGGATIPGRLARGPRRERLNTLGWNAARHWGLSTIVDLHGRKRPTRMFWNSWKIQVCGDSDKEAFAIIELQSTPAGMGQLPACLAGSAPIARAQDIQQCAFMGAQRITGHPA